MPKILPIKLSSIKDMIMTAILNYIQMFLEELRSWDNLLWSLVVFQPILVHIMLYSWLPITRTLANLNQNRFPLDFRHTFTVILPSVTRTLDNSNLPLTRSSFCFPSDHFYTILPSITRTMFCALFYLIKSREKRVYWCPKHWILNFPLTCCRQ